MMNSSAEIRKSNVVAIDEADEAKALAVVERATSAVDEAENRSMDAAKEESFGQPTDSHEGTEDAAGRIVAFVGDHAARAANHPKLSLNLEMADERGLTLECFYDYSEDKEYGLKDKLLLTAASLAYKQCRTYRELAVKVVDYLIHQIQSCAMTNKHETEVYISEWNSYGLNRSDVRKETVTMMKALGFWTDVRQDAYKIYIGW